MAGIRSVEVWLRGGWEGEGDTIRLGSLDEVNAFYESLSLADGMYGWAFIDIQDPREPWPAAVSVQISGKKQDAVHTLNWFTEARLEERDGRIVSYYLRGMVVFDRLWVERADGTTMTADEFADDGVRWWKAFEQHDPRTSVEAQRAARDGALTWRDQPSASSRAIE